MEHNDHAPIRPLRDRDPAVDNPDHYGGANNPYEVIKVLEAWDLNPHAFNAVKYIARAGKKVPLGLSSTEAEIRDLRKAVVYCERRVALLQKWHDDHSPRQQIAKEPGSWNVVTVADSPFPDAGKAIVGRPASTEELASWPPPAKLYICDQHGNWTLNGLPVEPPFRAGPKPANIAVEYKEPVGWVASNNPKIPVRRGGANRKIVSRLASKLAANSAKKPARRKR